MVIVWEERSINVTLVCTRLACAPPCGKCASMRLRAPLIAYRVSIVWSPTNILDVTSPSNAPPAVAEDDEDAEDEDDEAPLRGGPPHETPNVAIRRSARKRTARGD